MSQSERIFYVVELFNHFFSLKKEGIGSTYTYYDPYAISPPSTEDDEKLGNILGYIKIAATDDSLSNASSSDRSLF